MEDLLLEILEELRNSRATGENRENAANRADGARNATNAPSDSSQSATGTPSAGTPPAQLDTKQLLHIIRKHNEGCSPADRPFAKKQLLPYYLRVKEIDRDRWASWNIDSDLEDELVRTLRMKPRRTASGVATITVLTKPWPCSGECLYCPNDLRMPKSYLADEPACQRAERNWFDPYLQVAGRLHALTEMGHVTDKVELIVLGGTWSDYPAAYQAWFMRELFRALNDDAPARSQEAQKRRAFYLNAGIANKPEEAAAFVSQKQQAIRAGKLTYNQAVRQLYGRDAAWQQAAAHQTATLCEVAAQHTANETAQHRCVGLVVETRPDAATPAELTRLRQFGCTKVQMGIQSLDPDILAQNCRSTSVNDIERAFALLRLFGFKTHVHAMVNLHGSTPAADKQDYLRLVTEAPYLPDEVKLYPCVLVEGTGLDALAETPAPHANATAAGASPANTPTSPAPEPATPTAAPANKPAPWRPYPEDELIDVLAADVVATPPFTRISRMIRDISSHDIKAGNKKTNLRQMVEASIDADKQTIAEIRHREIGAHATEPTSLTLAEIPYRTTVSRECFLQWVTPENRIAGFLRLSLPDQATVRAHAHELPICAGEAMIREVHVYGRVASLHGQGQNAQHTGLGRKLVERACSIARAEGYQTVNVISAIGTREYYRNLGFADTENGLYLRKTLGEGEAPESFLAAAAALECTE